MDLYRDLPPVGEFVPTAAKRARVADPAVHTADDNSAHCVTTRHEQSAVQHSSPVVKFKQVANATTRMDSPWIGSPWIGGKTPWQAHGSDEAAMTGSESPDDPDIDTTGSMMGAIVDVQRDEDSTFKRFTLRKNKAGFGINVSNTAEVLSFNNEPDGCPGPAQVAGIVKMSRILEVNGVQVRNKIELLNQLKQLKAAGADEVEFGFLLPDGYNAKLKSKPKAKSRADAGAKTDELGKTLTTESCRLSDEFAEDSEEHFVFQPGTTLRSGRYARLAPLGRGVFARVVSACDTTTSATVAIKCLRRNERITGIGRQELAVLQQIVSGDPEKKSNCVRLLDHFVESGHLCIVCEKMDQNLRQVLQTKPAGEGLPLEQVREYGRQIFVALRYMSKLNLVHNDIKIDNMLLTVKKSRFSGAVRKTTVMLCDFGAATTGQSQVETPYVMARLYRAPELILGYSHGPAADLWGFACSLYELSTHKFLFPGKNNNHLLRLMTDLCGPVPKDMLAKSAFTSKHYNEKQQLLDLDSSFAPFAAQDKPMGSLLSYLCPKARREKLSPTDAKQLELFRDVMAREALRSWVR